MQTDVLIHELERLGTVSQQLRAALLEAIVPVSFPKNHFLLQPPGTSDMAYFIVRGFATAFVLVDGERRVEWFWKEHQFVLSPSSFFGRRPSREFIMLSDDSELLCINYNSVERIMLEIPESNLFMREILVKYVESSRRRIRELHRLSAHERFRMLIAAYPNIEQLVSQEGIASYLGITPQSLSRIKRLASREN